jgi:anti-sigma factor ChrR (cupin superfamily)
MLNMNFANQLVVDTAAMDWTASPSPGVRRKPLERAGAESGHATSIVEFAPGSRFDRHEHPQGEEIFILDGVFSDETGDYGRGTYMRNPPGTAHAPFSAEGCTLFVKLCQFNPEDKKQICIDTINTPWLQGIGGLQVMPLHEFGTAHTALVKWPAGEVFQPHRHAGGEEILVLSGTFCDEHGEYPEHSWIRSPHMSQHHPYVEKETVILVKTGHLPT